MAFFTLSPNMTLPIPIVGQDPGPDYAFNLNSSLTLIDQHDHSLGKGVQITPNGLNINTNLNIGSNFLYNVAGLTLVAQGSTPGNQTAYISGVDLYFVDGAGNNIRLTQSGAIAGTPGSITNLTSPASASYVAASKTFVWQSNVNIAANLDAASLLLRNISPNSTFAVTLNPPASLSSNYNLNLPTLPGSTLFLTLDTSGNIGTATSIQGTQIAAGSLTGSQIANTTITAANIVNATITGTQVAATTISPSNLTSSSAHSNSLSGSYSNTTTTFTTVASVSATSGLANRPFAVMFSGPALIMTDSGSGSTVTLQLIDTTDNITLYTWTFPLTASQSIEIPLSSFNSVAGLGIMNATAVLALQSKVSAGSAATVTAGTGRQANYIGW